MMKKTMAAMLLAMMQSAFAVSLMDGKYVNFEEYVIEKKIKPVRAYLSKGPNEETIIINADNANFEDYNCGYGLMRDYETTCVNGGDGGNWARRYFTNKHLEDAFKAARNLKGIGVYLPPGVWNFADQIVIPHGMTLKGSYNRPHNVTQSDLHATAYGSHAEVNWDYTDGTNIACYHGYGRKPANFIDPRKGSDTDACIAMKGTATLDGVNVFYPIQVVPRLDEQENPEPFRPVPYPWTISCQTGEGFPVQNYPSEPGRYLESADFLSRCSVMNTTLVNSYAGIDLSNGQDHYIKGVNMAAFRRGIRLDNIVSQGAIEDVNIHDQFSWSFYNLMDISAGSNDRKMIDSIEAFTLDHLIGMDFRRVDWGWINNVFIFKANRGFYFRRGYNGDKEFRSAPSVDIQNSGCDLCRDAVYVYELNPGIAVSFSNCNLLGRIQSRSDNYGQVRIVNSHLSFDAGEYGGTQELNGKRIYDRNHIEVAKNTTLQITNSEIFNFVGDPDLEAGEPDNKLWTGSTFNVRGKLLVDNTGLTWLHTERYNLHKKKIGGVSVDTVLHFRQHSNAIILTNNLLLRGGPKWDKYPKNPDENINLRSASQGQDGKALYVSQTNTIREPLETKDFFPSVKTAADLAKVDEDESTYEEEEEEDE